MTPAVSCICPTYGRSRLLVESIESFLRQDYPGESELVICNDCPEQTLVLASPHPRIRIENLRERCANLGEKRNRSASMAKHPLIMTWGDDDIHLPWRISDCVREWSPGAYVREGSFFYAVKMDIRLLTRAPTGPFLMAASDYHALGGIPPVNCGEDRDFFDKVRNALTVTLTKNAFPAFIYRWGTGHYHISGHGDDKPGKVSGWDRVGAHVRENIRKGIEPGGVVSLTPEWRNDYIEWARAALNKPAEE